MIMHILEKKNKIMKNEQISIVEKRERIGEIKMMCVLCKRNVGTLFTQKNKHYRAICGDKVQPCKLNIDLKAGMIINVNDSLEMMKDVYLGDVNDIIKAKLDLLFNFKTEDEVLKEFEFLNESLKSNSQIIKHYTIVRDNMIEDDEKKEKMKDINNGISVLIDQFKKIIQQYKDEKKISLLKEAMELQQTKLAPLLNERIKTKYAYQAIEQDVNDDTYYLVQKQFLKNKMEDVVQPAQIITNNTK